jgi:hypothetical protein
VGDGTGEDDADPVDEGGFTRLLLFGAATTGDGELLLLPALDRIRKRCPRSPPLSALLDCTGVGLCTLTSIDVEAFVLASCPAAVVAGVARGVDGD